MKIDWNIGRSHGLTISHYAFPDPAKLREGIRQSQTADFVAMHATKTSLSIDISSPGAPEHRFGVAYIPKGAEKFKFHRQVQTNMFTCVTSERHRFKLGKTQGLPELKEYLSLILEDFVPDMEELTVNLTLHNIPELPTD